VQAQGNEAVKEVLQSNVKTEENKSHKARVELIRSVKKQTEPDGVKRSSGRSETEENRKRYLSRSSFY
jgi:hypothetical protein